MLFSEINLLIFVSVYLICAIPFGYLIVRFQHGVDVRNVGSGNIGATNVLRAGGKAAGILTLFLDVLKGAGAVFIAHHFSQHNPRVMALAALIALLAHMYPVYLKFKGGKGVATGLGVFLVLAPWAALCVLSIFIGIVAITRLVSLGSILAAAFFPVFYYFLMVRSNPENTWILWGAVACCLLIVLRHSKNIQRMVNREEHRFGRDKS
jgi:glycerol-3-phosphate acyltransferase PlsY